MSVPIEPNGPILADIKRDTDRARAAIFAVLDADPHRNYTPRELIEAANLGLGIAEIRMSIALNSLLCDGGALTTTPEMYVVRRSTPRRHRDTYEPELL